jgi:hypothetical protein
MLVSLIEEDSELMKKIEIDLNIWKKPFSSSFAIFESNKKLEVSEEVTLYNLIDGLNPTSTLFRNHHIVGDTLQTPVVSRDLANTKVKPVERFRREEPDEELSDSIGMSESHWTRLFTSKPASGGKLMMPNIYPSPYVKSSSSSRSSLSASESYLISGSSVQRSGKGPKLFETRYLTRGLLREAYNCKDRELTMINMLSDAIKLDQRSISGRFLSDEFSLLKVATILLKSNDNLLFRSYKALTRLLDTLDDSNEVVCKDSFKRIGWRSTRNIRNLLVPEKYMVVISTATVPDIIHDLERLKSYLRVFFVLKGVISVDKLSLSVEDDVLLRVKKLTINRRGIFSA